MKGRFALAFPYICAVLVTGFILWNGARTSVMRMDAPVPESADETSRFIDPVCHMEVGPQIELKTGGRSFYFCCEHCRDQFRKDPERYLADICLVCRVETSGAASEGGAPRPADERFTATWQDRTYRFCSIEHREAFRSDPAGYFMHTMWGIPPWLYYCSIAVILLLSFGIIEWRSSGERGSTTGDPSPGESRSTESAGAYPRWNLLRISPLRRLIVWPPTRFLAQLIVVALFALIVAAGLFGSQLPSKNIAPLLTWTIWWGGLILLVAYAGKAWCYVCPWDAIAGWAESQRFWGKRKEGLSLGLAWPRVLRNIWPATILFVGLTWIELGFGVTMKPRVTAWLALLMLGLSFVCAFIFSRRAFCRYGCLVGRISGLYALFSPVEVRAKDRSVCHSCRTHSCYRGNADGEPCPTFESLRTMDHSTYCINCMECVKTCEPKNVALQLRPWGQDLTTHRRPRSDEAYLALLMLSLTGFHGLTMTPVWRSMVGRIEAAGSLGQTASFTLGMAAVMIGPPLLYAFMVALSRWASRAGSGEKPEIGYYDYFIRYAYALIPIALFYHLAHNSEHLLMEGQKVVALFSDPFGFEWNLFGTAGWNLLPLINLPTLWVVQVFLVMIGHVYSLWIARRTAGALFPDARTALRSQLPMLAAMIMFSLMSLWLLKQPMEMRTSAM